MPNKTCLRCGEPLLGRSDKKFCDDHCRSSFNNSIAFGLNQTMKQINQYLKRNRMILWQLFREDGKELIQVSNTKLQEMGFKFKYHTHLEISELGETCLYCYDFGIIPNGDEIKVIRQREQN
jgi:hypothetical protein